MTTSYFTKHKFLLIVALVILLICCLGGWWGYLRAGEGSSITRVEDELVLQKRLLAKEISTSDGVDVLPYRMFVPSDYSEDKQYPLVIWLHGAGGRGTDNVSHLDAGVAAFVSNEVQQHYPAFVLAPQCPSGHQWVEINRPKGPPYLNYNIDEFPQSVWFKLLFNAIEEIESTYSIDTTRRYVSGFSMGAAGTWDIIVRHPKFFAAAMPLAGRADPSKAKRISHLPIWTFHGRFDTVAPMANTREMEDALSKVGGNLKVTALWRRHMIVHSALQDMEPFDWLFKQRKRNR